MRKNELIAELKKLNVGKLDYARHAGKLCRAKNREDAFFQGFCFARNSLQKQKGALFQKIAL